MNAAPRLPETLDEDLSFARGSPLFSVLTRIGVLPADRRQLAATLSLVAWLPLLILSAFAGMAIGNVVRFPFLLDFPNAVRFLVSIPLLVMGEGPVTHRTRELADYLFRSGLVDDRTAQAFSGLVRQTRRMRDSRLAEAVAGVIVLFAALSLRVEFSAATDTWQVVASSSGSTRSAAGWWYVFVRPGHGVIRERTDDRAKGRYLG